MAFVNRIQRFFNLRRSLIALGLLLVLGGTALAIRPDKADTPAPSANSDSPAVTQTTQETKDIAKPNSTSTDQPSTPPLASTPGQKASVTPVVSSWGQNQQTNDVEASGFVSGIYESGTCTLIMTKGGQQVTESKTASLDAQSTSCGLITIARSRLSAGSWTLNIKYESAKYSGTSQSQTLEVK